MHLTGEYLKGRATLVRVFLLIDARRGLKDADQTIMHHLDTAAQSYQLVLTKADKVGAERLADTVGAIAAAAADHRAAHPLTLVTSAITGEGIDHLRAEIALLVANEGRESSLDDPA
jgi:GTP-binding protein